VLTFLGGLAAKEKTGYAQVGVVAGSIKWFAFGVALAVFGIALAYLTNFASAGIASSQAIIGSIRMSLMAQNRNIGAGRIVHFTLPRFLSLLDHSQCLWSECSPPAMQ
jgi:hypothetical protein